MNVKIIYQVHSHNLENYGVDENGKIFRFDDNFKEKVDLLYEKKDKTITLIDGERHINAREIVMYKFYGELPNTEIISSFTWKDLDPTVLQYVIEDFEIVDENTMMINGNLFKRVATSDLFVSEKGVVFNITLKKFIQYKLNDSGYIFISVEGKYRRLSTLHQLMWEAFVSPVEDGMDVHHKDNKNWHNELSNLQYMSHEDHMKLHNMPLASEQKITDEICIQIFEMKIAGKLNREIAEVLEIPLNTVISITTGKKHKKIYEMYKDKLNTRRNLTFEEAHDLVLDMIAGESWSKLQEKYGVSRRTIEKIKWGETHKQLREKYPQIRDLKIPK